MVLLFAHENDQRALARLIAVSVPMGGRVLQYCTLFTPPKTRLTAAKKIKLVLQLLPDLERQALTWRGREWVAPLPLWAQAIDQMLAARDAGRLDLPMKGHAYLHAIVAGMADKAEGAAEAQSEAARFAAARAMPAAATVQVRGQPMTIGDALQQVHGGRDPALVKADASDRNAAPMPAATRAKIAELRGAPKLTATPNESAP